MRRRHLLAGLGAAAPTVKGAAGDAIVRPDVERVAQGFLALRSGHGLGIEVRDRGFTAKGAAAGTIAGQDVERVALGFLALGVEVRRPGFRAGMKGRATR